MVSYSLTNPSSRADTLLHTTSLYINLATISNRFLMRSSGVFFIFYIGTILFFLIKVVNLHFSLIFIISGNGVFIERALICEIYPRSTTTCKYLRRKLKNVHLPLSVETAGCW